MKVIKSNGTTATIEEANILSWSLSTVVNPFIGQPSTSAQVLVFSSLTCVAGAIGGYLLRGTKYGKKMSQFTGIEESDGYVS